MGASAEARCAFLGSTRCAPEIPAMLISAFGLLLINSVVSLPLSSLVPAAEFLGRVSLTLQASFSYCLASSLTVSSGLFVYAVDSAGVTLCFIHLLPFFLHCLFIIFSFLFVLYLLSGS